MGGKNSEPYSQPTCKLVSLDDPVRLWVVVNFLQIPQIFKYEREPVGVVACASLEGPLGPPPRPAPHVRRLFILLFIRKAPFVRTVLTNPGRVRRFPGPASGSIRITQSNDQVVGKVCEC